MNIVERCDALLADAVMEADDRAGALRSFETLVLAQKPAITAWTAVTDYSIESREKIEGDHPRLIQEVFQPKAVMDCGCGPDGILVRLLQKRGILALGFDVQLPMRGVNPALTYGDVADPFAIKQEDGPPFADLVICREVLEHLTLVQIKTAITNLCRFTKRFVYVTTRFSSEHDLLRVETHDDLDPTHISLPSKDLLRLLFVLEGMKRRADLEDRMDHQKKHRVLVYEKAL